MSGSGAPIDRYLDDVVTLGRALPPARLRSLIAEAEAHLRDSAADAAARGLDPLDAERAAVVAFGPASDLVGAERAVDAPWRLLALRVAFSGALLGGVGAIAVGLSGVVAAIIRAVAGDRALVDSPGASTLTPANCARWLGQSSSGSCRSAAMADWANETVYYRIALGILGVIAVMVVARLARRARRSARVLLDRRTSDTIACTLFVTATAVTAAAALQRAVGTGDGWGQWLSAAVASAATGAVYVRRLVPELRRPAD